MRLPASARGRGVIERVSRMLLRNAVQCAASVSDRPLLDRGATGLRPSAAIGRARTGIEWTQSGPWWVPRGTAAPRSRRIRRRRRPARGGAGWVPRPACRRAGRGCRRQQVHLRDRAAQLDGLRVPHELGRSSGAPTRPSSVWRGSAARRPACDDLLRRSRGARRWPAAGPPGSASPSPKFAALHRWPGSAATSASVIDAPFAIVRCARPPRLSQLWISV